MNKNNNIENIENILNELNYRKDFIWDISTFKLAFQLC